MFDKYLKEYLSLSKSERKGITILASLIILVVTIRFISPYLNNNKTYDGSNYMLEIADFEQSLKPFQSQPSFNQDDHFYEEWRRSSIPEDLIINPNLATAQEWLLLGLSPKRIETIQNYLASGGRFYSKDDLNKIYGLSEQEFKRIENHIYIEPIISNSPMKNFIEPDNQSINIKKVSKINLNTADTVILKDLRGIGTVLANRIIRYRELLGGFVTNSQLMEVYGIDEDTFNEISPYIYTDTINLRKINLNVANVTQLRKHPYLSSYDAESLIKYRTFKSNLLSLEELLENSILEAETFAKMAAYFTLE